MPLASILCCLRPCWSCCPYFSWIVEWDIGITLLDNWTMAIGLSFFLLSNYWNIENRSGQFKKSRTSGYRIKALIYRTQKKIAVAHLWVLKMCQSAKRYFAFPAPDMRNTKKTCCECCIKKFESNIHVLNQTNCKNPLKTIHLQVQERLLKTDTSSA